MRSKTKSLWNMQVRVSEELTAFFNLCRETEKLFQYCQQKINELDKETQDWLHKLELDTLDSHEKAKIATQLKRCRKERRYYKDRLESVAPLRELLDNNPGKMFLNAVNGAIAKTKKVEEYHACRTYIPRVVKEEML